MVTLVNSVHTNVSGLEKGITNVNGTTLKPRPAPRPPRGATRDPPDGATASPPRGSEHRPQGGRAETRGADGGRPGGRGAGRGLVWRGRAGGWAGLFLTYNYPIYTLLKISLSPGCGSLRGGGIDVESLCR